MAASRRRSTPAKKVVTDVALKQAFPLSQIIRKDEQNEIDLTEARFVKTAQDEVTLVFSCGEYIVLDLDFMLTLLATIKTNDSQVQDLKEHLTAA